MSMQNSWDLKCKNDTKKIKIKFYTNDMVLKTYDVFMWST